MIAILGSPAKIMMDMSIYIAQDHGCARPRACKTTGAQDHGCARPRMRKTTGVQDDGRNDPDSWDDGPSPGSGRRQRRGQGLRRILIQFEL